MTEPGDIILVLAGGRSSRMGAPKPSLLLADGSTLLGHVLGAVEPLHLPVVLGADPAPEPGLLALGLPVIADDTPHEGPLVAIGKALRDTGARGLLAICCDQPLLRADILARLLPPPGDAAAAFFRVPGEDAPLPFPGYYPAAEATSIARALAAGERSPRRWAAATDFRSIALDSTEAATLTSCNTPDDLTAAGLLPPQGLP